MLYEEYLAYDAVGLAKLVREREVSSAALIETALARLETVNPRINAVVHRFDDQARRSTATAIEGPFGGVPFLVKDLDGVLAGAPLTMGCRALRNNVALADNELVARYRRAGVIFLGGTNSPELGLLATTEPELHGPTRNPWDIEFSSGGSSGGAAAAVAAGIVPVAHGSDGGGSIRIPASACGVFGLKPTRGRMPLGPDSSEEWNGFVVPHVLTRSVRDCAAFLDVSQGADAGALYATPSPERPYVQELNDPPKILRIAYVGGSILGETCHPDCMAAVEDSIRLLSQLGHQVEEVRLPISREEARLAYLTIVAGCTATTVDHIAKFIGKAPQFSLFEAETWFLRQVGYALSAADIEHARITIGKIARAMGAFMTSYDVVMTPTMAYPPPRIGEYGLTLSKRAGLALLRTIRPRWLLKRLPAELAAEMFEKTSNTMLFNMTGQPAMSVPLWWSAEGLPIGIQFAGRFGDEAGLLKLAHQLELERPWFNRHPPL